MIHDVSDKGKSRKLNALLYARCAGCKNDNAAGIFINRNVRKRRILRVLGIIGINSVKFFTVAEIDGEPEERAKLLELFCVLGKLVFIQKHLDIGTLEKRCRLLNGDIRSERNGNIAADKNARKTGYVLVI